MRSRKVFKTKATNLILQDANGEEIEFPDLETNQFPDVGEKILIDGKGKETGERLMPNGTLIKFKDGIVIEVITEPKDIINLKATAKVQDKAFKTFTAWKNNRIHKIEILGNNEKTPFRKGNRVLVNGKKMMFAKYEFDGKEMKIRNGRIDGTRLLQSTPTTTARKAPKATGKTMIGKPIPKPKQAKQTSDKREKPTAILGKIIWMVRSKVVESR